MVNYFKLVSDELLIKLNQTRQFIKKHNPTIGVLTEEILRSFLKNYLPKSVSVEQGFILSENGMLSKQCDILIYDSNFYAPFYRINDIVVVPSDSVIAVIEVKTTLNKSIFHSVIDYFENISMITGAKKYLFVYNSCDITKLSGYFQSYKHKGDYQQFDHNTFQSLPDEITGINNSYHLRKDSVIGDREQIGYSSYFFNDEKGTEISALQNFYISVYSLIEEYNDKNRKTDESRKERDSYYKKGDLNSYFAFGLFDM
ncbi:MAG: hypothetical protein A2W98_15335 [Bacteroidetes bacterium GWF2_33_38]|nr:MAG: hypothetical protein A2W98_15335 [Bacteroidetes bacterium GWF2_33_38]OFY70541.1 MAG: hypothetical protein A2265_03290 [Bacteroidetes bacterium RIFOXYA12_FULL_33_9]OFY85925.1 MAG: hypothetical protein A2236_08805 [Bacteroidetes bacterium RIFOXYA2_FULL_33_7]